MSACVLTAGVNMKSRLVVEVKIEMENMTQCELQGAKWNEGKIFGGKTKSMGYVCIKGK